MPITSKTKKPAKRKAGPKKKPMKLPAKLLKYLEEHGVDHEILEHKTVYTALDAAATMKKKINEIGKALYVKADKDYYVVVLPADQNLDFGKLAKCLSAQRERPVKTIKIPGEKIMENALKLKQGAMSAFGRLHKLPVVVDEGLAKAKKVVLSSGSHNHSIEMRARDFIALEKALVGKLGKKKPIKKQKKTAGKKR